jgi:hypothetical protein
MREGPRYNVILYIMGVVGKIEVKMNIGGVEMASEGSDITNSP